MTADTGMSDKQKLAINGRLDKLSCLARGEVTKGTRSRADADVLLQALQAFKENRLGGIINRSATAMKGAELIRVLNTKIDDLPLSKEEKKYFRQRGVMLLGELYYVIFDPRSRSSREFGEKVFETLNRQLNVPESLDPLAIGWRPCYWDEPGFNVALNKTVMEAFGEMRAENDKVYELRRRKTFPGMLSQDAPYTSTHARVLNQLGVHYMAQLLDMGRRPNGRAGSPSTNWSTGKLGVRRSVLGKAITSLHAAALVPPDWTPVCEVPQAWVAEETVMLREQAEFVHAHEERRRLERERREKSDELERTVRERIANEGGITDLEWGVLYRDIGDLRLIGRDERVLRGAGIELVGQLIQLSESDLYGSDTLALASPRRISAKLSYLGLKLGLKLLGEIPEALRKPALIK